MDRTAARTEPRLAWAWVSAGRELVARPLPREFRRAFRVAPDALTPEAEAEPHVLVPVVTFAGLAPRERPRAFCPACLERVTLKLGRVVRGHFAHRPHTVCAAARGEGARHLGAKLHLAAELAAVPGAALSFRRICRGVGEGGCYLRAAAEPWPLEWDGVAVEVDLGGARPDVALLRGGRVVAALEVRASHAVDPSRAERYRALGLPWLEVPAQALQPDAGLAWSADQPLEVVADADSHPAGWRCPICAPRNAALKAMAEDGVRLLAARPVHLYRRDAGRSGGEVRVRSFSVRAVEGRRGGCTVEVWLERSDNRARIAGPEPVTDSAEALGRAHALFRGWAAAMRGRGAVVESPTGWSARPAAPGPQRLRWDDHAGRFRGAPNLPSRAWAAPASLGEGWATAHPILGYARCAWSEAHARRGVLTHAIAGPWWLTLSVQGWEEAGERLARADVRVWRHTGAAWKPVAEASHAGPSLDWAARIGQLAEAAARLPGLDAAVLAGLMAATADPGRSAPPSPR